MFEDFLNHRCDIYHLKSSDVSPGYGLSSSPSFDYSDKADIECLQCHFGVKSLDSDTQQKDPQNLLCERIKLTLPIGTDIRINDKVIDCGTGYEYTAEKPVKIRAHHVVVYVKRKAGREAL